MRGTKVSSKAMVQVYPEGSEGKFCRCTGFPGLAVAGLTVTFFKEIEV
jgi:hypothetical protein